MVKIHKKELVSTLKKSSKNFGQLFPVLVAFDGTVIDGNHRLEADPSWRRVPIETRDKGRIATIKLLANLRRELSHEEKTEMFDAIAKECGWSAKKIARNLGLGVRTVRRYLSSEYKDRSKVREQKKENEAREESAVTLSAKKIKEVNMAVGDSVVYKVELPTEYKDAIAGYVKKNKQRFESIEALLTYLCVEGLRKEGVIESESVLKLQISRTIA